MIHQISIHVISIHGLCLKFITLSCQLTFCQPSFPASVPIPPEKQKTQWNLWLCSTYTWPKRGTYQRGSLTLFFGNTHMFLWKNGVPQILRFWTRYMKIVPFRFPVPSILIKWVAQPQLRYNLKIRHPNAMLKTSRPKNAADRRW